MVRSRAAAHAVVIALVLTGPRALAQSDPNQGAPVYAGEGDEYADTDPSALTDFRATLDPHGSWVDDPSYGTVWTPDPNEVGTDFEPYDTAGHWDYVDGDYAWVSDYAWGWVCFHYGRWAWSSGRWVWIAGRLYAAAWVNWRVGEREYAYLGWAPMPPSWVWIGGGAFAVGLSSWGPWAFATYEGVLGPGLPSRVITGQPASPLVAHTRPYAPAQPTVGTSAAGPSQPVPHGPPPALLGIDVTRLPRPKPNAREVRARQYARPSTALPLGAHAPTPRVVRLAPTVPGRGVGVSSGAKSGGRERR